MTEEEWPYDEHGFPRRVKLDIEWFLRGAGFDGEDDAFVDDKIRKYFDLDFVEYDENGRLILPTATLGCGCNPRAMLAGAQELATHLSSRLLGFPRTESHIEMLRVFSDENKQWRKWVDPTRSAPSDENGPGSVCLWGCHLPGHSCFVNDGGNGHCTVTGVIDDALGILREGAEQLDSGEAGSNREVEDVDDDELSETFEREEQRYDLRTFGDLEVFDRVDSDSPDPDPGEVWIKSGYSAKDVQIFVLNGITPEDATELAKLMPARDVAKWVARFKDDWSQALALLKAALGMTAGGDAVTAALSESVRMAVHSALRSSRRRSAGSETHQEDR
jgi:hypothetical protein